MRALLFHCKEYKVIVTEISTRPPDLKPEELIEREQRALDCVAAFITVEGQDNPEQVSSQLVDEMIKMSREVGTNAIVIVPFGHLSNNLADTEKSISTLDLIGKKLSDLFHVVRTHFGSHKELLLHLYGHPGNVRYREF